MTTPTLFRETALALHVRNWRPIPLRPDTKVPAEPGWDQANCEPRTDDDLRLSCGYYLTEACGIALPRSNLAVDLDILDPALAAEAERLAVQHLGDTPLVRIGMAPKSVRLYRADGTVASSKRHPVELFCGTGQIAAFGWHAKAGRPYLWPDASPLEIAADDPVLPLVTAAKVRAFLLAVAPLLGQLRAAHGPSGRNAGRDAGELLRAYLARGLRFRDAARRVLQGAQEGGRHAAVLAVIAAGYNRGIDADALWTLIHRHAPADVLALVLEDGYLERTLSAFAPRHDAAAHAWRSTR